jgi:thiol-activated cytolysin
MRQFSYFEELKLAFGANVNIGGLLNIDVSLDKGKIRKKTGLFAKIVQRNYTVDMDLPADGNILLNHDDMGSVGKYDPIYISSIRKWYVAENK